MHGTTCIRLVLAVVVLWNQECRLSRLRRLQNDNAQHISRRMARNIAIIFFSECSIRDDQGKKDKKEIKKFIRHRHDDNSENSVWLSDRL